MNVNNESKYDNLLSINDAARRYRVTRQAIYVAIRDGRLNAKKIDKRWWIDIEDLKIFRKKRYSREKSTFAGAPLYDNNKGYYSVKQTAKILKLPKQKIYYATRSGYMKAMRKGAAWVIHIDEINNFKINGKSSRGQKNVAS
ncbi:helix-turn-helix domain-containing protein [Chlamydiia bacterium]|nr:helix-turn-helix domain-containing protein [Chlamydiia bacterium]